ncbi:AAA family ATPase [Chitinophaga japonensis]|uniref:Putative nucleotidyltransferase with HDIG domain n=1 Tax=Chitinophaga japonensis TaxID=104662 RepID=A0A562T4V9_CHIJA|nr:AAA family ATPase [Chitinophaga japonensis]TWI88577.1 putative nucleotidyltransferase with HDIG domain [Chitinophaga japonensis]
MWTITDHKDWTLLEQQFDWVRDMREVPQDALHHAEGNVAIHTKMVLEAMAQDVRYQELDTQVQETLWAAALLHDVEKRSTTVTEPDGRITAHGHARKGAQTARFLLYRDLPAPFFTREEIVGLVRHHSLPLWLLEKPDPLKTLIRASMEVNTRWLAMLARADVRGRICQDQEDLLYRVDCFEEFCNEQGCWGATRPFRSAHARMHYLERDDAYPDYEPFEAPEMEVVLMSGLPGAGKDTFVKKHFPGMPVISLDDIRLQRGIDPGDKTGNGQAIQEAKERARVLLRKKTGFVWNATNTTAQMRSQLISLFLAYRARVKIVYVESPYMALHKQNRDREAVVPPAVIDRLVRKLEVPAPWEAHEVSYHIQ